MHCLFFLQVICAQNHDIEGTWHNNNDRKGNKKKDKENNRKIPS